MKLPLKMLKNYKDYEEGKDYLVEVIEGNYLLINKIARELKEGELEKFLDGLNSEDFEALIFSLLEEGEDQNGE